MSGRKQHFIPQVLLRGFAHEIGRSHRLWVHHRERGSYESNVVNVAAARDFYSPPRSESAPPTLDDQITTYEDQLTIGLSNLRAAPAGIVASEIATAVVSHLSFRTEAIRDLTGEGMLTIQRLKTWLARPESMLAFIGADGPRPGRRFDSFIDLMRADPRWSAKFGLKPRWLVRNLLFQVVRNDPDRFVGGFSGEAAGELEFLLREHRALSREAHVDALSEDVASRSTEDRFEGLIWSVMDYNEDLPLPDTVVLASGDGREFCGLPWVGRQERREVIMPLSSNRLLQGQRQGPSRYSPFALGQALVEGANAFVVSRRPITGLDPTIIGRGNAAAMDRAITGAVSEMFSRPLRRRAPRSNAPSAATWP